MQETTLEKIGDIYQNKKLAVREEVSSLQELKYISRLHIMNGAKKVLITTEYGEALAIFPDGSMALHYLPIKKIPALQNLF